MKKLCLVLSCLFMSGFLYCGGGSSSDDSRLSVPTGVTATDGIYANYVIISWNSVSNADWYAIFRGTSPDDINEEVGSADPATITSWTDTSATQDTHYWYAVTATSSTIANSTSSKSTADEGWSSNSGSTIDTPGLNWPSQGTYPDYVNISWNHYGDAAYIKIYRGESAWGPFTYVGSSVDDSYDDLSVTADIHYYYTISAVDYSGIESYKDDYGQEGWADSASTIYTFRVVNGTAGIISTHISSSTSSQNQPDSVHKVTYASKPGSITWSASSYNTGMGETLTWGDTYIPATEMTHTEDPHLESDHFALWIKNSSSYTWNRFYYNNTDTTYTAVPLPPDSSIYYFMGFFTPRSTSTYWQTTVDYTNFWKWGDGGASYSYSQNSYGSYFVNCVGID